MTRTTLTRRRSRHACAVDVGTARTRLVVPGRGLVVDEPTLLAYGRSGEVVAVGSAAARAAAGGPVRLVHPVHHGELVDPVGCVHLLACLMARADVQPTQGLTLAIGVPVGGRPSDVSVAAGIAAAVGGGPVIPVDSALAAAIGAGADVSEDAATLVCDIGIGLIEVAAVGSGRVLSSAQVPLGLADLEDPSDHVLLPVTAALVAILDDVPDAVAADLVARPLLLVGGGGLHPGLADRLAAACRMPVLAADRPRDALVEGLGACLL